MAHFKGSTLYFKDITFHFKGITLHAKDTLEQRHPMYNLMYKMQLTLPIYIRLYMYVRTYAYGCLFNHRQYLELLPFHSEIFFMSKVLFVLHREGSAYLIIELIPMN